MPTGSQVALVMESWKTVQHPLPPVNKSAASRERSPHKQPDTAPYSLLASQLQSIGIEPACVLFFNLKKNPGLLPLFAFRDIPNYRESAKYRAHTANNMGTVNNAVSI